MNNEFLHPSMAKAETFCRGVGYGFETFPTVFEKGGLIVAKYLGHAGAETLLEESNERFEASKAFYQPAEVADDIASADVPFDEFCKTITLRTLFKSGEDFSAAACLWALTLTCVSVVEFNKVNQPSGNQPMPQVQTVPASETPAGIHVVQPEAAPGNLQ